MSTERDKRIDGEYDRPLPERIKDPTKVDYEKLKKLLDKYNKNGDASQKETLLPLNETV